MKHREFTRHLVDQGCILLREGGKYSIFQNPKNGKMVPVTRHTEIADFVAKKICRSLDVPHP